MIDMEDKEVVLEMYQEYKTGKTLRELEKRYKVSSRKISSSFKNFGLKVRRGGVARFKKSEILEMYEIYREGFSSIHISKKFNTSPGMVLRYFHKYELPVRSNAINSRRYYCNEEYFQEINSPDKAYWLGFIYADGFITSKRTHGNRSLGISLAKRDIEIIKKFKNSIESNHKINIYKASGGYSIGAEYCRILIPSKKMTTDLMRHGVLENKTKKLKSPDIKYEYIRHFIRGYMDGDGSITKSKKKEMHIPPYEYGVSIMGTEDLLRFIHNYLKAEKLITKQLKFKYRNEGDIVASIVYGGNLQTLGILNHLYDEPCIYLKRKYERYLELKEHYNKK